jgi:hypothetical protein
VARGGGPPGVVPPRGGVTIHPPPPPPGSSAERFRVRPTETRSLAGRSRQPIARPGTGIGEEWTAQGGIAGVPATERLARGKPLVGSARNRRALSPRRHGLELVRTLDEGQDPTRVDSPRKTRKETSPPTWLQGRISGAPAARSFLGPRTEERGRCGVPPRGGTGKTLRSSERGWRLVRGAPRTRLTLGRCPTVVRAVRSTARTGGSWILGPRVEVWIPLTWRDAGLPEMHGARARPVLACIRAIRRARSHAGANSKGERIPGEQRPGPPCPGQGEEDR